MLDIGKLTATQGITHKDELGQLQSAHPGNPSHISSLQDNLRHNPLVVASECHFTQVPGTGNSTRKVYSQYLRANPFSLNVPLKHPDLPQGVACR
jgi:hypothetical protein